MQSTIDRPWSLLLFGAFAAFFWVAWAYSGFAAWDGQPGAIVLHGVYLILAWTCTVLASRSFPRVRMFMEASA